MKNQRKLKLIQSYKQVVDQVKKYELELNKKIRIVLVSKYQSVEDIQHLYDEGALHFGENYVQELIFKSQKLPSDIKWHFIGNLQKNKCNEIIKKTKNLHTIETLDSLLKAVKLETCKRTIEGKKIKIFLQINVSNEITKSGFKYDNEEDIQKTIEFLLSEECKFLKLKGLMTIGSLNNSLNNNSLNEDFHILSELKKKMDKKYGVDLELSMGMSNDFLSAIKQGSTNVRIGSLIFGARTEP